jgi:hypothetical protein
MSAHTSKDFSYAQYEELMNLTFEKCRELGKLKGSEYSGDLDRLANFRRNGLKLQLPMEVIWAVYAAKHWDAIAQYIEDIRKDKKRDRLETIEGRIDDLIVYLVLFKCMVYERTIY